MMEWNTCHCNVSINENREQLDYEPVMRPHARSLQLPFEALFPTVWPPLRVDPNTFQSFRPSGPISTETTEQHNLSSDLTKRWNPILQVPHAPVYGRPNCVDSSPSTAWSKNNGISD